MTSAIYSEDIEILKTKTVVFYSILDFEKWFLWYPPFTQDVNLISTITYKGTQLEFNGRVSLKGKVNIMTIHNLEQIMYRIELNHRKSYSAKLTFQFEDSSKSSTKLKLIISSYDNDSKKIQDYLKSILKNALYNIKELNENNFLEYKKDISLMSKGRPTVNS